MKKISVLLFVMIVSNQLSAQNVGIGTTTPKARLHVHDSNVVFTATIDGFSTAPPPISGAGARMMWYGEKGAFRVGHVDGNRWDEGSIGYYSFASGLNTLASGSRSTAMGAGAIASSSNSVAIGFNSRATGLSSVAIGGETEAQSFGSIAIGQGTTARSYGSFAAGWYNDSIITSDKSSWVLTDPLFYLGNGSSSANCTNALVIYKNGNADINGFTRLGKVSENAPSIKTKMLTGTTAASQGAWADIAHGVTRSKILSVNIIVKVPTFTDMPPSYTFYSGYQYDYHISNSNIVILNSPANSSLILSKAMTVLITYME
ncbi:MAG: hypothetical protein V4556_02730 [Bacteroidota bacterium]